MSRGGAPDSIAPPRRHHRQRLIVPAGRRQLAWRVAIELQIPLAIPGALRHRVEQIERLRSLLIAEAQQGTSMSAASSGDDVRAAAFPIDSR